ncbi:MAG TPA: helix-turn-helix transcriptional regulator [Saprospiraceae bacterium]|nr:hypothetical protein [Saprospirales bacterium]HRQ30216.1 helix-turn-helix transcriptional regulator [Saprospiraceae bacterium]
MALTREEKIAKLKQLSKPEDKNDKWREIAHWNKAHADSLEDFVVIALRIAEAIKEQNIRQTMLAERLAITPQALTRIMKGRQNLTLQTIRKLEQVLDICLISIHKHEPGAIRHHARLQQTVIRYTSEEMPVFSGKMKHSSITETVSKPSSIKNYLRIA